MAVSNHAIGRMLHSFRDARQLIEVLTGKHLANDLLSIYKLSCPAEVDESRFMRIMDHANQSSAYNTPSDLHIIYGNDCMSHFGAAVQYQENMLPLPLLPVFTPYYQPFALDELILPAFLQEASNNPHLWESFSWLSFLDFSQLDNFISIYAEYWSEVIPSISLRHVRKDLVCTQFASLSVKLVAPRIAALQGLLITGQMANDIVELTLFSVLSANLAYLECHERFGDIHVCYAPMRLADPLIESLIANADVFQPNPLFQIMKHFHNGHCSDLSAQELDDILKLVPKRISEWMEIVLLTLLVQNPSYRIDELSILIKSRILGWNFDYLIPAALDDLLYHTLKRDTGLCQILMRLLPVQIWGEHRFMYALSANLLPISRENLKIDYNQTRLYFLVQSSMFFKNLSRIEAPHRIALSNSWEEFWRASHSEGDADTANILLWLWHQYLGIEQTESSRDRWLAVRSTLDRCKYLPGLTHLDQQELWNILATANSRFH